MNAHSSYSSIDIGRSHTSYGDDLLESSKPNSAKDELHHQEGTSSPKATKIQRLKDHWTWEILSLVLSLVTVIAIAIVLRILDGKPLSWWRSSISPNSLVSIFAAVSKSAMILPITECISQAKWIYFSQNRRRLYDLQLFDDASRGPLGSLIFLWQSRINLQDLIAFAAAVVMIAALAVDPFMQQIISYPLRSVPTAEIEGATTPIARTYDSGTVMDAATAKLNFAGVDMQTAIVNGLLGISLTPTFHCSTGNCTWPELTKLGVCGSCMNVTEETKKDCGDRDPDSSMQTCDYTTPANITITATTGLGGNGTYTYLNSSAMSISADDNAPLLRLGILRSPPTANVDKDGVLPPDISECSFEWCAQQCSGFSVSKGVLQQGGLVSAPLNAFSNGSWTPAYVGDRVYASLQAPDGMWQGNRTFFVHTADYNIARQLLENLLVTQLASFNEEAPAFQVAPVLLFAPNISQTMADIATSMTNVMQSSENGTEVIGQAFHNETFVHVRWPWLILPATLVFITAILLQAAVVESHRRNSLLWKSSILPFLFHGFEKPVDAPPEKLSLVEARAWSMAACLEKINEREYRFILA